MSNNDRIEIFTSIYENNIWGKNTCKDSSYKGTSGDGSSLQYNINSYIPFIKQFIDNDHEIYLYTSSDYNIHINII